MIMMMMMMMMVVMMMMMMMVMFSMVSTLFSETHWILLIHNLHFVSNLCEICSID